MVMVDQKLYAHSPMMNDDNLKSGQNIHALGLSYIFNYLDREGYKIFEVNTDPNHHFQFMAKRGDKLILVAVRTAYHPDFGAIDNEQKEQLINESNRLKAIPHFAGLAVTPLKTTCIEIDGCIGGKEYEVNFDGIKAV